MRSECSFVLLLLTALTACALTTTAATEAVPRTIDGRPDLDGYWDFGIATPLERPDEIVGRASFTAAEVRAIERVGLFRFLQSGQNLKLASPDNVTDYEASIPRRVGPDRRTSLIIDPPDGRIPNLTPAARARESARSLRQLNEPYADPEALTAIERCIAWNAGPPPLIPAPYNNFVKIVQTRDALMIASEMIHDARVIPLDNRPHLTASIRQWKGDSVGRWDGDTLVIDTTGFNEQTSLLGSGPAMHVVERLTRLPGDDMRYEFTVDDPESFTQKWTAAWIWKTTRGPLLEYACHEGNYSIVGILRGARQGEREGATPK
jgi:hypothetical protein